MHKNMFYNIFFMPAKVAIFAQPKLVRLEKKFAISSTALLKYNKIM
jgi:hypothetical protein